MGIMTTLDSAMVNILKNRLYVYDGSIGNLRTNCSDLVNEYSSVVFHSRYNENKVLISETVDGNPDNVAFNYSLPGVNDDVGGSRDNFTFIPPVVGVSVVPSLDIKITDSEGNAVNDADGAPLN